MSTRHSRRLIGIHNHGTIKIGDTFTQGDELQYTGIPNFGPEHFRKIRLLNPLKSKALEKGLIQLSRKGQPRYSARLWEQTGSSAPWATSSST